MKLIMLSALGNARIYPPVNIPGTHFWYRLSRPQGDRVAGRITSMENPRDTIGNRTRDLPDCRAVPQAAATQQIGRLLFSAGKNGT